MTKKERSGPLTDNEIEQMLDQSTYNEQAPLREAMAPYWDKTSGTFKPFPEPDRQKSRIMAALARRLEAQYRKEGSQMANPAIDARYETVFDRMIKPRTVAVPNYPKPDLQAPTWDDWYKVMEGMHFLSGTRNKKALMDYLAGWTRWIDANAEVVLLAPEERGELAKLISKIDSAEPDMLNAACGQIVKWMDRYQDSALRRTSPKP